MGVPIGARDGRIVGRHRVELEQPEWCVADGIAFLQVCELLVQPHQIVGRAVQVERNGVMEEVIAHRFGIACLQT